MRKGPQRLAVLGPSNAHAQPPKNTRDAILCRELSLVSNIVCANFEGSGETVWMRWFA